ncbi:hypothetical protein pb186bvf_011901 [Paramecium bursaria]
MNLLLDKTLRVLFITFSILNYIAELELDPHQNYYINTIIIYYMGAQVSKQKIFRFGEEQYNQVIQQSIGIVTDNNNNVLQNLKYCTVNGHNMTPIDTICINIGCNANSRMVCSVCMRDELHKRDKNFVMSQFIYDHEINKIMISFKILIYKQLDCLEFDLLVQKLVNCNPEDQQKMFISIKNIEELNNQLETYRENIQELDKINYYEELFILKNLSLFEYLKNRTKMFINLQEQFYQKFSKQRKNPNDRKNNTQAIGDSQVLEILKIKKQILLDLKKNPIYKQKLTDQNVKNLIDSQVNDILQTAYFQTINKNYDVYQQICQNILYDINFSATQYSTIVEMKIKIHMDQNQQDKAIEILNQIIDNLPMIKYFYNQDQMLQNKKDEQMKLSWTFDEAKTIIDKIIKIQPFNINYYEYKGLICKNILAEFLTKYNKFNEALMEYDKIIKFDTSNTIVKQQKGNQSSLFIAEFLAKHNKLNQSLIIFDDVINQNPFDTQTQLKKAEFLVKLNKSDEALIICDKIIKLEPLNTQYYLRKADFLEEDNKLDQALNIYDELIKLSPYDYTYLYKKADFLVKYNRFQEALIIYDKIINKNPYDVNHQYLSFLQNIRGLNKHQSSMIQYLIKTQKIPSVYLKKVQILNILADLLEKQNKLDQALIVYDNIIKLNTQDISSYQKKVDFLERQNMLDEVLIIYDQLIMKDSSYTYYYFKKVEVLEKLKRFDEALNLNEKVIKLNPYDQFAQQKKVELLEKLKAQNPQS